MDKHASLRSKITLALLYIKIKGRLCFFRGMEKRMGSAAIESLEWKEETDRLAYPKCLPNVHYQQGILLKPSPNDVDFSFNLVSYGLLMRMKV